jgi:hypothetical protein
VIHTPRIGLEAARLIAAGKADAAVGIADRDGLAAGILDDLRAGGARLAFNDASDLFAALRGEADPAEVALATKAATIGARALGEVSARDARLGDIIAAVEGAARGLGAEEIYVAAAPDLGRDRRLIRIEGEMALGESFALRATVAYKGVWIRLVRTFGRDGAVASGDAAAARLAAAVAELPSARGLASLSSWLVEGCRIAQPLEPLMGSRVSKPRPPLPRALISVQAGFEIDGRPVLVGAPALVGGRGEASALLVSPF